MALDAFTRSNLTAQAIVQAADREAGSPGLYLNTSGTEDLTAPAYVRLQAILDHLAMTHDWPFRDDAITINCAGRATTLPDDYWRAAFNDVYWYDTTGTRRPLPILGHREWHERTTNGAIITGPPQIVTIMKNAGAAEGGTPNGVLYLEPAPDQTYLIELHYDPLASPLSTISSKVWFPYAEYLIEYLASRLFVNTDDQRAMMTAGERDKLFREIRKSQGDAGQRGAVIRHSPLCFRPVLRI